MSDAPLDVPEFRLALLQRIVRGVRARERAGRPESRDPGTIPECLVGRTAACDELVGKARRRCRLPAVQVATYLCGGNHTRLLFCTHHALPWDAVEKPPTEEVA